MNKSIKQPFNPIRDRLEIGMQNGFSRTLGEEELHRGRNRSSLVLEFIGSVPNGGDRGRWATMAGKKGSRQPYVGCVRAEGGVIGRYISDHMRVSMPAPGKNTVHGFVRRLRKAAISSIRYSVGWGSDAIHVRSYSVIPYSTETLRVDPAIAFAC